MSSLLPRLSQSAKQVFLSATSSSPTLNISLERDVIFVNPPLNPTTDQPLIEEDPTLIGTLLLNLPEGKKVKCITVILEGITDSYAGYATKYESSICLRKEVVCELNGELLEGNQAFNFCFLIPSNTAVFERSTYGRVKHSVRGIVEFIGKLSKDLVSTPVSIWITNNPLVGVSEVPEILFSVIQVSHDILGPILATFSSPHLSVSSLLQLDVALSNPPSNLTIVGIESYIQQAFSITYDSGKILNPQAKLHKLEPVAINSRSSTTLSTTSSFSSSSSPSTFNSSGAASITSTSTSIRSPIAVLSQGVQFDHRRTFRLPGEDILRPSTLPSTSTRIKVSHKITLALRYELEGEEEKVLVLSKPGIMIKSCSCLLDSLLLPEYSKTPVPTSTPYIKKLAASSSSNTKSNLSKARGNTGRPGCTCLEELVRDVELNGYGASFRLPVTFDSRFEEGAEGDGPGGFGRIGTARRNAKSSGVVNVTMRSPNM